MSRYAPGRGRVKPPSRDTLPSRGACVARLEPTLVPLHRRWLGSGHASYPRVITTVSFPRHRIERTVVFTALYRSCSQALPLLSGKVETTAPREGIGHGTRAIDLRGTRPGLAGRRNLRANRRTRSRRRRADAPRRPAGGVDRP